MPRTIAIGFLGVHLDRGTGPTPFDSWRPTICLVAQEDLLIDRLLLLHPAREEPLALEVARDIGAVSPETEVVLLAFDFDDPWDFAEVYARLYDFARAQPFQDDDDVLVHITTGTHAAQICLYLLTESRRLPARLVQTSPPPRSPHRAAREQRPHGTVTIIDLDLSRYDQLAARFAREREEGISFLKDGIDTRNAAFNALIERIERVSLSSTAPILLTGRTGVGKTRLARRLYELKKRHHLVAGAFVEVNCATLRGDGAMSALFGHAKGAFTGADRPREGLLLVAHGGLLFLDEIGELGLDEQAMLLRALEDGTFLPLGTDRPATSRFQLIAGTNRDLGVAVRAGRFREDLLARIDLWTFELPSLRDRPEDLEPNVEHELERLAAATGRRASFNREARARFLGFAISPSARWSGNFRDLAAAVQRMATLAGGARIDLATVQDEIARLTRRWEALEGGAPEDLAGAALGPHAADALDLFDRVQLDGVLRVCRSSRSLSEAGRALFAASRARRASTNDADRLRKYLGRFGLRFEDVREARPSTASPA